MIFLNLEYRHAKLDGNVIERKKSKISSIKISIQKALNSLTLITLM